MMDDFMAAGRFAIAYLFPEVRAVMTKGLEGVSQGQAVVEVRDKIAAEMAAIAEAKARPVSAAEIAEAEAEVERTEQRRRKLVEKCEATNPYVLTSKTVPLKEISFGHLIKGGLALLVLTLTMTMIPIVGAATVAESGKVPLFADAQLLSGLYASMAMAGAIGLAFLRSRFDQDRTRKRYDIILIAVTILAVLNFIGGLAFSAFPPGSDAVTTDLFAGDLTQDTVADPWVYPAWALILSGGALEICAGGLLSTIVTVFILPKCVTAVSPNPEWVYLSETLIPAADVACEGARARLYALKDQRAHFEANLARSVDYALRLFDRLTAQMRRNQLKALETATAQIGDEY